MGCKLFADKGSYSTADVVIIHQADVLSNKNLLPQWSINPLKCWVWVNMEPPLIISNLDMLDNLFNITMTFHQDSDISTPYGHLEYLKEPQNFTIPAKSKLVASVVSKWYQGVRGIEFEELRKKISIDIYGAKHKRLRDKDFQSTISQYKFYKFYLFTFHKDYITEKLWSNAFGTWTVPVVLGTSHGNYERFVPGDAFIHVNDFPSPKELPAYLLELDKDDEKYRKYFNWRYKY
ncbi:hypothetical protein GDO81_003055 [Engystomops pustulosus]|uniref:Fucosyltransferase n=1 Tax=Engystomops pustulosus TaxID=76066 RepID=A0AAV6ZYZ6_ENGPU|nr:hypothetical protein GDO81_003055 [Engystomops pustulosus]